VLSFSPQIPLCLLFYWMILHVAPSHGDASKLSLAMVDNM
jgi:hypothetical protein